MNTALIGLVGVVVGGLLSGGIAYVLARRDEVQRRRASARLVLTEIAEFRFAIKRLSSLAEAARSGGKNSTTTLPAIQALSFSPDRWFDQWREAVEELDRLPHPLWSEHRPQLARYLPDTAWLAVSNVYEESFPRARSTAARVLVEGSEGLASERPSVRFAKAQMLLDRAVNVLRLAELELQRLLGDADTAANALGSHAYESYSEVHTPGATKRRR